MSSSSTSKMKKFTFKNVLDGLRGSSSSSSRCQDTEIEETLRREHFDVTRTARHGFPYQPTSVAFDPLQRLLAVGNRTGSLRIIGQPGVDFHCSHESEVSIIQILFLVNELLRRWSLRIPLRIVLGCQEYMIFLLRSGRGLDLDINSCNSEGGLVTVTSDDHLHLWNFIQKKPAIVHSLKFQREKISRCHLPFQSKWLYVGTERGNVHVVNIETFTCSGYIINWNKAIELSRKTHPGPVVHLSDNPVDSNKLLIGFESGAIVFWDLKTKLAEYRYNSQEALRSISWHNEGKQFMCSHSDGSLSTWNVKSPQRPCQVTFPHARMGPDGKPDLCKPIAKVEWKSTKMGGEAMVVFSGGISYDKSGRTPSITVMTGKSTTVLEMEYNVVDFVCLSETPWVNDFQDPYAIVVLLQNDLVIIDLTTPGYPCFENPYPMDLHESPVTACQYYANCPVDIIPALYSSGKNQKKTGFSDKPWPIKGGSWGSSGTSYPEIIITGHADGTLKFWDASSVTLQFLYKLKTSKVFDKPKRPSEDKDDDPFAIQSIFLCSESRIMCVAGPTHCIIFKFSKQETSIETIALEFSIIYEIYDELDSPEFDFSKPSLTVMGQHSSSVGSYSSNTSDNIKSETVTSVKAKTGSRRWGPGFIPDMVCILTWVDGEPPGNITVMSLNSSYGLLAFGNESGLAIVDYMQKTCLLNLGTPDLYGSMDPYQRAPRSPRSKKNLGDGLTVGNEECKSPTVDQSNTSPDCHSPSPFSPPTTLQVTLGNNKPEQQPSATLLPRPQPPLNKSHSQPPPLPPPLVVKSLGNDRNRSSLDKSKSLNSADAYSSTLPGSFLETGVTLSSLKVPPPRPPSPKKKFTKSPQTDESDSIGLFQEDHFANEKRATTADVKLPSLVDDPVAPPRTKSRSRQRTLVHQPALDLPPSPNRESSGNVSPNSPRKSPSPSRLTPTICLPRSNSETREISPRMITKENSSLLRPDISGKPKSISTGDISLDPKGREANCVVSVETCRKALACKTLSDSRADYSCDNTEEDPAVRKALSDPHLTGEEERRSSTEITIEASQSEHPTGKNWLLKKIHKVKTKKKKGTEAGEPHPSGLEAGGEEEIPGLHSIDGDDDDKEDLNFFSSSDCEGNLNAEEEDQFSSDVTRRVEKLGEGDELSHDVEDGGSAASGKNFFYRVSLKIRSLSSRKSSYEEDDRDIGPAPTSAHRIPLPKSHDRRIKIDVLDLTDDGTKKATMRKMYLSDVLLSRRAVDKTEGSSFSRSRSSSMSSLENVTKEAIQCLVFADSYTRKSDNETSPCLWVGTSLGSVIVIVLVLQQDQRLSQPVIVSPSGSLYRMKGAIVCMSFLDFKGVLIPALCEQWREVRDNRDSSDKLSMKASRQMSVSNSKPKISPTSSTEINNDRQFAIICSERQARAISLPSQTCAFKVKVTETSFVVRAEVVAMRESVCLMCYVANGHIVAFSLPSLKPLFDADFLPLTDYRVARTFCFSNNGHAMFLTSPTEIQKITYSAEISENLNEMLGELFLARETPEPPKQGFLKSLFGGGVSTLDREELFGEASGKASKGLAKHIPGTGGMQQLQQQAAASGSEFTRTRLLLAERGEKLGDIQDRTEQMMNQGEHFAQAAHQIMSKWKDKKWYQF